jgi:2,4-dienoyl-CoA reductase (NADPH2)
MGMFDKLFEPIKINSVTARNRIVYPALALMYSMDNSINERYINYYQEKAKGGAGIVTVGPVLFCKTGAGVIAPSIEFDESIPEFRKVTKVIKDEGALAWIQLYHAGAYSYRVLMGGDQAIAPSAVYSEYAKDTPREMTIEDISRAHEMFIQGAERAKKAGFDGVEILGSAGYLITQFLSPVKNLRTDQYGGSFENRARFARELIEKMRSRLGVDFPLTIRMAGNDFVPGSTTDIETPEIARMYQDAGIDAINVTGGWHESRVPQLAMELPRGGFAFLAKNIKDSVTIPVIASNRIAEPHLADRIIRDGMADMVSLGRVLIADPYWPKKAMELQEDEIRPCVACSQGCTDELFSGRPVMCIANAEAGFENNRIIPAAENPKNIMVIGAGPGGLEAAYRAAKAGHNVRLFEKKDKIGGQLHIAGTPPNKQELWELIRYYGTMLSKYNVKLNMGIEVTIEMIRSEKPDYIIAAEGAEPFVPPIDGIESPEVISAWDILEKDSPIGSNIAVIGGGAVGLETAEFIAEKGTLDAETLYFLFKNDAMSVERLRELVHHGSKTVTVFEMRNKIAMDVGKSNRWVLLGNISKMNINVITDARVISLAGGLVKYEKNGEILEIQFDNVINAVGSKSVQKLSPYLEELGIPYAVIGDGVRPGRIDNAVHQGYLAVMNMK